MATQQRPGAHLSSWGQAQLACIQQLRQDVADQQWPDHASTPMLVLLQRAEDRLHGISPLTAAMQQEGGQTH